MPSIPAPVWSIVTVRVSLLFHWTLRPVTGFPTLSASCAVNCWVNPITITTAAGLTVTVATVGGPVTSRQAGMANAASKAPSAETFKPA